MIKETPSLQGGARFRFCSARMGTMDLFSRALFVCLESPMRRLTGTYDGVEHVVLEHDNGTVECPSDLRAILLQDDDTLPTGVELENACLLLFGDSLVVREL